MNNDLDTCKLGQKICNVYGRMPYVGELKLEHESERVLDVALMIIERVLSSSGRSDFISFLKKNKLCSLEGVKRFKYTFPEAEAYRVVESDERYVQLVREEKIPVTRDYFIALYRLGYFRNSRIPEFMLTRIGDAGRWCYCESELVDIIQDDKENIEERTLSVIEEICNEDTVIDKALIEKFLYNTDDPVISMWDFADKIGINEKKARRYLCRLGNNFYKDKLKVFMKEYYLESCIGMYRETKSLEDITLWHLELTENVKRAVKDITNEHCPNLETIMKIRVKELKAQPKVRKDSIRKYIDEITRNVRLYQDDKAAEDYKQFMRRELNKI